MSTTSRQRQYNKDPENVLQERDNTLGRKTRQKLDAERPRQFEPLELRDYQHVLCVMARKVDRENTARNAARPALLKKWRARTRRPLATVSTVLTEADVSGAWPEKYATLSNGMRVKYDVQPKNSIIEHIYAKNYKLLVS